MIFARYIRDFILLAAFIATFCGWVVVAGAVGGHL